MVKKYTVFNIMRALSMLWVVGFWHLQEYIHLSYNNPYTQSITNGVLGVFFLLSGLFMGKRVIENRKDLIDFYIGRIVRIYVPFAAACLVFLFLHYKMNLPYIVSYHEFLATVFGVAWLFPPGPSTVWFVSLLITFYAITPVVIRKKNISYRGMVSVGIILLFVVFYHVFNTDSRTVIFSPLYYLGILMSQALVQKEKKMVTKCIKWSWIGLVLYAFLIGIQSEYLLFEIIRVFAFASAALFVSSLIERLHIANELAEKVSYLSYMAYLFHRIIYGVLSKYMDIPAWAGFVILLPTVLFISYGAQKTYDFLVDKVRFFIKKRKDSHEFV